MPKKKKSAKCKSRKVHSRELIVDDQQASSFAGLSLVEKFASHFGIWIYAAKKLSVRRGIYERLDLVKAAVAGFLSGSRGSLLVDGVRQDDALLRDMGIERLPGEKVFCEDLKRFGSEGVLRAMHRIISYTAYRVLKRVEPEDIQINHGFIPLFGDGTLLEGSRHREGTKYVKDKGLGLMWGAWMLGPMVVSQHLCADGEGEQSALMGSLDDVLSRVVNPLHWRSRALVMMDSLHGDEPTLERMEHERLRYVIGANKLKEVKKRLQGLPEEVWTDVTEKHRTKGYVEEQTCTAYVQCESWKKKRMVFGKRFRRDGDLVWNYTGIFSNIPSSRIGCNKQTDQDYALKIWKLYSLKMGMEDRLKDLLLDLAGHKPPCQELEKNRGYYALLTLAHNLARGIDQICGVQKRKDLIRKGKRRHARMRISTLRRHLFTLPGFITVHARKATVKLIGGGAANLQWFEEYWNTVSHC